MDAPGFIEELYGRKGKRKKKKETKEKAEENKKKIPVKIHRVRYINLNTCTEKSCLIANGSPNTSLSSYAV
jgi:hypothetical protein